MTDAEALVFVVDDDASLRTSLQDLLESVGLRVAACASAQEFLRCPPPERGPAAWCSMCGCQASAGWSCSRNWPMLACWKERVGVPADMAPGVQAAGGGGGRKGVEPEETRLLQERNKVSSRAYAS